MKKKAGRIIAAVICIGVIVGAFYWISASRAKKSVENQVELTEVEKLLTKDLEKNYPLTPREVVKSYNRMVSCLYNETCTNEQIEGMADQLRILMDDELKEQNPKETYAESLKTDVESYKLAERKIVNVTVSDSADVQYKKKDGRECAYVKSSYFMEEGDKNYIRSVQCFVLRKDEAENWKILGFYLEEGDSTND